MLPLLLAVQSFASLFNNGLMNYNRRQFPEAADWLERAIVVSPRDFNSRFVLGSALVQLGKGEDALRHWRVALEVQPNNVKLMQAMSVEYSKGGRFIEAAAVAERALAMQPREEAIHYLAIKAREQAGEYESALKLARNAAARFEGSARAQFELGYILHRLGRLDEAAAPLAKAIAADPAYEEPYYYRGDILLKQDRLEEAEKYFRLAVDRRADYGLARLSLGRTLIAQGKLPEAARELEEAARRDIGNPQPYVMLAQVYYRMGRDREAAEAKEKAARLRAPVVP